MGCNVRLVSRSDWDIEVCVVSITVELYIVFADYITKWEHISGE